MQVDPGSLVALNVLLEERSVTRAARRLGITQSSMSHRLARLRDELGDPLFVRVGATLTPTPRALAIAEPLADALRALDAALATPPAFDPVRTSCRASIIMPDLLAAFAASLVSQVSAHSARRRCGQATRTTGAGSAPTAANTALFPRLARALSARSGAHLAPAASLGTRSARFRQAADPSQWFEAPLSS
ncbi:MAG TPA: LysR family transcriptional regulator [Polyangiaceae bacterium]|nr:LysR family transcriptional regulator [Polyangiaceae bacterium]